jgi:hypothetical protein
LNDKVLTWEALQKEIEQVQGSVYFVGVVRKHFTLVLAFYFFLESMG